MVTRLLMILRQAAVCMVGKRLIGYRLVDNYCLESILKHSLVDVASFQSLSASKF